MPKATVPKGFLHPPHLLHRFRAWVPPLSSHFTCRTPQQPDPSWGCWSASCTTRCSTPCPGPSSRYWAAPLRHGLRGRPGWGLIRCPQSPNRSVVRELAGGHSHRPGWGMAGSSPGENAQDLPWLLFSRPERGLKEPYGRFQEKSQNPEPILPRSHACGGNGSLFLPQGKFSTE